MNKIPLEEIPCLGMSLQDVTESLRGQCYDLHLTAVASWVYSMIQQRDEALAQNAELAGWLKDIDQLMQEFGFEQRASSIGEFLQHLRQIQADAGERVITGCQLILERVTTTYRENPGMGFSATIEDKTAKQLKQELRKDFATYAARVKAGEV